MSCHGRSPLMIAHDRATIPTEFNRGPMCLPAGKEMDNLANHVDAAVVLAGVSDIGRSIAGPDDGVDAALRYRIKIDGRMDTTGKDVKDVAAVVATRIGPIGIDHKNRRTMMLSLGSGMDADREWEG
ncbi:hypothetical protein ACLOJK_007552 [Asimina triloba]